MALALYVSGLGLDTSGLVNIPAKHLSYWLRHWLYHADNVQSSSSSSSSSSDNCSPEDAVAAAAAETRLVIDQLISSDLFHLVDSLSTLQARVLILEWQTRHNLKSLHTQSHTIIHLSVVCCASRRQLHIFPEVLLIHSSAMWVHSDMSTGLLSLTRNKIAFQSKANHRGTEYKHVLLTWPWPWPDDLDIRTWPRYVEDVPPYQIWNF